MGDQNLPPWYRHPEIVKCEGIYHSFVGVRRGRKIDDYCAGLFILGKRLIFCSYL